MRPTVLYLQDKYRYYNNLCFEGNLPNVLITLSDRKGAMGRTSSRRDNITSQLYIVIEISVRFDLPEEEYIDTLVHEMIHCYIQYNNIQDDGMHGRVFTSIMNRIIHDYGIKVTKEYCPDQDEIPKVRFRWHYVNVLTFADKTTGFSVVARNKVFALWEFWATHPKVLSSEWYLSYDPFFDTMPTIVSPRFFSIDRGVILRHLANAERLVQDATGIHPE